MKRKAQWIAVALVLLGIGCWTSYAQRQRSTTTTATATGGAWEYKVVYVPGVRSMTETALNELGAQGWELVTFQQFNREGGTIGAGNYYLKRPKTTANTP